MFEDTVDYYPTPEELATIMVTKISEKPDSSIMLPGRFWNHPPGLEAS